MTSPAESLWLMKIGVAFHPKNVARGFSPVHQAIFFCTIGPEAFFRIDHFSRLTNLSGQSS